MSLLTSDFDFTEVLKVLSKGGTILYPTDTIWGLGCDATNKRAAEKIFKIKGRQAEKSLIILVDGTEMLKEYVEEVPDVAYDLIKNIKEPLTIIYEKSKNLPRNIVASDGSVAVRIPKDEFCIELIKKFGKPVTSTSANLSGAPNPLYFSKIDEKVKNAVDYIVPVNQFELKSPKASTIIRITDKKEIKILRE